MRINFKTFRKIKEDVETATLKNDRGHEITLAKKSLRPHLLKNLTELPLHLAEGTPEGVQSPNLPEPINVQGPPGVPPISAAPFLTPEQSAVLASHFQPPPEESMANELGQVIGKYGVAPVIEGVKQAANAYATMGRGALNAAQDVGAGVMKGMGIEPAPQQMPIAPPGMVPAGGPELASAPGMAPQMEAPTSSLPAAAAQVGAQPAKPESPMDRYNKGLNQQVAGINAEVKAIGDASARQQKIYEQQVEASRQLQANYQQQLSDLNTERENLIEDIKNSRINPNQYVENMSSGQRRNTWIGLLLSGAGSGLSRQNNLAADYLQKQIERDIDAQVKNLGNKNNLLTANYHQFQNLNAAIQMTRVNLNDIMAAQISEEAARSAYPMAQAKAQQAIGALMADSASKVQELAKTMALRSAVPTDPKQIEAYIQQISAIDPKRAQELKDQYVPGVGLATTNEGGKGLREMQHQTKTVIDGINRLREIMKTPGKSLSLKLRDEVDTIRTTMVGALRVPITGPGSMQEQERQMLLKLIPAVADFTSLDMRSKSRLDALEGRMNASYSNMLAANGLKGGSNFAQNPNEGKTAVNQQGQRIIMRNGKWVPK